MASTSATPNFNVGGLASGLDTNTIISQMMSIERQPQTRLAQRQAVEQARQAALRDVQLRLQNLQSAANGLKDGTAWTDVQAAESSDPTHVAVTRTAGAAPGGYTVSVAALARAEQQVQTGAFSSAAADDTLHLAIGGGPVTNVSILAGDSLQNVADRINATAGSPAYASVINSKLVLSGKQTGAANTVSLTSDGSTAADLGMTVTQTAQNADFTVGTTRYTDHASNVVTDVMPGISITLKGPTATAAAVTVSAPSPNTDAVTAKVQAFVDQYNSTIDFIRAKLTEKVVPNPATDDDRTKGVLNGDQGLTDLLARMRTAIADPVAGVAAGADRLSSVGLSTGSASATVNADSVAGKLTLDGDALSNMLSTRFADVKSLFTNPAASDYSTQGLAQRLAGLLGGQLSTGGGLAARITGEQTQIDDLRKQQADMETSLTLKEAALRAQFTAMETALSQAQSQSSWLTSQIASLPHP